MHAPLVEQIASLGVELNANQYKVVRLAAEYDTTLDWFHDGFKSPSVAIARTLGIQRWVGVGNKVDTDEARQAIKELCADHDVPLDVIIPSTADIVAADRRGEPLDRAVAPDVWDAVESLVDALELDVVPVG